MQILTPRAPFSPLLVHFCIYLTCIAPIFHFRSSFFLFYSAFPSFFLYFPSIDIIFTASTDAVPVPSMDTAQEVGPLTSSPPSRGQSSGRALWRAAYAPRDGQTSPAYSSQPVQCLYINRLLPVNKSVLSYLLLRLLPQELIFYLSSGAEFGGTHAS
jgi:hypothetical protein